MKKYAVIALFLFFLTIGFFAHPFFSGRLPIPSDTIVGLYYPFRDSFAKEYPRGVPYKNSLITDPVRQTYPWRNLSIALEKVFHLPLWNPYSMAGYPLLANMQSASLYPLNILFFVLPFSFAWSILILLEPLLAGLFLYLFLRNRDLHPLAGVLGGLTFAFGGFMVSWLEWGTVGQVALWLPLILLSVDKLLSPGRKKIFLWSVIFVGSLTCSFLAGHAQTFFYVSLISLAYFFLRWFTNGKKASLLLLFVLLFMIFAAVTTVQWIPFLELVNLSARNIDQLNNWQKAGWFIPWQHIVQFIAPDFFGNPATLNYWGVWNYGELTGYIGILPLLLACFGIFTKKRKDVLFFAATLFVGLLFAFPTPLAKLPFIFQVPFLSTAQPTRLLFVIDFSLAVLAGYGLDLLLTKRNIKLFIIPVVFLLFYGVLWLIALGKVSDFPISPQKLLVAKHNLYLPTLLFVISTFGLVALSFLPKRMTLFIVCLLVLLTAGDLLRFADKFTPFTDPSYLFPNAKVLDFLKTHTGNTRIMSVDSRILPPNFSVVYGLQSIDGYDPLYLLRYGEFATAMGRGKPDISPPFGFNRIVTPQRTDSSLIDLLGVRYVLSLTELSDPKLREVYSFGQTRIYRNTDVYARTFFVENILSEDTKQLAMHGLFNPALSLKTTATIENYTARDNTNFSSGSATIVKYSPDAVQIKTQNNGTGFLVLTDVFYPTWRATICDAASHNCKATIIYPTDFLFRGIVVPQGSHIINFSDNLF